MSRKGLLVTKLIQISIVPKKEQKFYKYDPNKPFKLPIVPCIYKAYNELLYVGKATNERRFLGHHKKSEFLSYGANRVLIISCSLSRLDFQERLHIKVYKPLLNERLQEPIKPSDRKDVLIKAKVEELQKIVGSRQKPVILTHKEISILISLLDKEMSELSKECDELAPLCHEEEAAYWEADNRRGEIESILDSLRVDVEVRSRESEIL